MARPIFPTSLNQSNNPLPSRVNDLSQSSMIVHVDLYDNASLGQQFH